MTEPEAPRREETAAPRARKRPAGGGSSATARLFTAIEAGDEAAVEKIVKRTPRLLAARDGAGRSPVAVAAYRGHPHLAERLADATVRGGEPGLDPFEAAMVDEVATLRSWLDGGGDVASTSRDGFTALHFAAFFGRLTAARLLLDRGANPNAVAENESRVTPLHSALAGRHRDVASLLLAHGAGPNVVQEGGYTPLHAAAQNGDEATAELLLLRGADPTRLTDEGQSSIDIAEAAGHAALAKVLRESVGQRQGWAEPPARPAPAPGAAPSAPPSALRAAFRPDYADTPVEPQRIVAPAAPPAPPPQTADVEARGPETPGPEPPEPPAEPTE